ncbi:protein FORGETTER 1, partial [Lingula anatina]|uniref:Protein FORGETTER 1 n=1 Tax=Lingula anatina TaxID=7574 RepID=A0A1S3IHU9_LINAN
MDPRLTSLMAQYSGLQAPIPYVQPNPTAMTPGAYSGMGLSPGLATTGPYSVSQDLQLLRAMGQENVIFNRTEGPDEMTAEIGKMAQEGVEEMKSDEVFSTYKHNPILPDSQEHPGDIVEAGSLAAISLPKPEYSLSASIPSDIITSCKLSSLQLEGILYACQRHQHILPDGRRAGFFMGDGAGVGKGRQIAGILLDNFARGRNKHIWFSISTDLIVDARRDLTDIGCHVKVIEGCQQLDRETRVLGLPAGFKEGVIFSTYATLVSSVQKGGSSKQSRLKQLVDWCGGEDFDGCLIFDECHKAKNFVPGKEQASTKVAMAVVTVQRLLPKARVVYCSATGVTDVKNMAFMERLGLWGDGMPFKSFEHFMESVHRKGLGVAEMLAMEMKSSGMYVSRGLSFKQAEFMTVEASLTEEQIQMYDTAAHVWNELRKALESAVVRTNCSNTRIWSQFWSSHQRFFKQLCMGMKVPTIVSEAQQALQDGFCVVIGLQTTGEV